MEAIAGFRKLCAALVFGALLAASARAGHFTVDPVTWLAPYSASGNASASLSGRTASWNCSDFVSAVGTQNLTANSSISGTVQWKIVWHRDSLLDVAPSSASVMVAKYGHVYTTAGVWTLKSSPHGDMFGWGQAQDNVLPDSAYCRVDLPANTKGAPSANSGSTSDAHYGYFSFTSSTAAQFTQEDAQSGTCVAYVAVSIIAQDTANGRCDSSNPLYQGNGGADVSGQMRVIVVNSTQVADDFPGGTFPTSGYGN